LVNEKCYLCNSDNLEEVKGVVRDAPEVRIKKCAECGLVFLSGEEKDLIKDYKKSEMHTVQVNVQEWLQDASTDDERRFKFFRGQIKDKSILDFGCGAGGFLLKAKSVAAKADGIELEEQLKPHFSKNGLNVYSSLEEALEESRSSYDIITAFHVIEHTPDPARILKEISMLLKSDGKIIVEVPNSEDALLTLYESDAFSRFTYWSCHLFLFNAETIKTLGARAGLNVESVKQVQRYPISNHLYWLSKNKPGGHNVWSFMDSPELNFEYENKLTALGKCDTIIAEFSV
jgi:2-polyprenyl-3-methyl-5-hydroxy-6-metoxy-1,4-benzoquinol methylase